MAEREASPGFRAAGQAARESYGKLLALLSRDSRDIAAAEDALSFAFAKALETHGSLAAGDRNPTPGSMSPTDLGATKKYPYDPAGTYAAGSLLYIKAADGKWTDVSGDSTSGAAHGQVVKKEGDILMQILNANDEAVQVEERFARITLNNVMAGEIYMVYVKFRPNLKGIAWEDVVKVVPNWNCAIAMLEDCNCDRIACVERVIEVVER